MLHDQKLTVANLQKILILIIALAFVRFVQGEPIDIIVAKDGSGKFTKISEAVSAAPNHSARKFYIKIKAGTYVERIHIGMEKTNLAFTGDGMDVTIITYNRSNHTGYNIIESATVGNLVSYNIISLILPYFSSIF